MPQRSTVAVIGAGFSGVLTALRLLAMGDGPVVRLIERRPRFAQGAAYATTSPDHLLNVRAGNMSAFAEQPDHFTGWLRARGLPGEPHTFVTRKTYGDYLQDLLMQAIRGPGAKGRLVLEADEVVAAARDRGRWRLELGIGRSLAADAVVLALGNLPPHAPCPIGATRASGGYIADPWSWDMNLAPLEGTALLLGTGLTMVDVALSLAASRPRLKMIAVSRRGLLPRRHAETPPGRGWESRPSGRVSQVLARLRGESRREDWRATVDHVRPHVQAIWRDWPLEERRRFLRHARPWWDVHRHRLSPPVAERIDHLTASGALRVVAGQALGLAPTETGVELTWRPRGGTEIRAMQASLAVNCTGPAGALTASADPLIRNLVDQGLIRADACDLGLDVDPRSRLVAADGAPNPTLFGVGPITRGAFWEMTSVPDIRVQAAECAAQVVQALQPEAGTPARASAS